MGRNGAGRFASCPLDAARLPGADRYVELNPVRAGLVDRPEDWPWSSAAADLAGAANALVVVAPMLARIADWRAYLDVGLPAAERDLWRRHERSPLGSVAFVDRLEARLGRRLKKRKPGPAKGRVVGRPPKAEKRN